MPITRRPQRRAALQASQHLAYAAFNGPSLALNEDAQRPASRPAVLQEGNQWYRSNQEEGKGSAVEEWRERRVKRRLVDLEVRVVSFLPFVLCAYIDNSVQTHTTSLPRPSPSPIVPSPTTAKHLRLVGSSPRHPRH